MTDEQINVAIALHLGWKSVVFNYGIGVIGIPPARNECDPVSLYSKIWTEDLNAMHEAEKSLDDDCKNGFRLELLNVTGSKHFGSFEHIHATARQRAEAFLRTLDKWEEVQA